MNVLRPHVSAKEELGHRLRHMPEKYEARLEALARDPAADLSQLDEQERGIVLCMRDSYKE